MHRLPVCFKRLRLSQVGQIIRQKIINYFGGKNHKKPKHIQLNILLAAFYTSCIHLGVHVCLYSFPELYGLAHLNRAL